MRVPKNQGVESLRWGMFLEGVNEAEESEQTALHSNALRTKNPLTVLPPSFFEKGRPASTRGAFSHWL